jgi:hypothetical protein
METLHVVLTGRLLPGTDFATAVEQLAGLTKLDRARVERLLQSGQPTVVKRSVSVEEGERYRTALTAIGVEVELRPSVELGEAALSPQEGQEPTGPPPPPESGASPPSPSPSTVTSTPQDRQEQANPGRTAALWGSARQKNSSDHSRSGGLQPAKVSASHGWQWIKEAIALFFAMPGRWCGFLLATMFLLLALNVVPLVGNILSVLLGPVFSGSLMLAAERQRQGEELGVSILFLGFSCNRNQLLLLGACSLAYGFALFGTCFLLFGLNPWGSLFGGPLYYPNTMVDWDERLILMAGPISILLSCLMAMAFWFAPCLVALENATAWESLQLSLRATLRNWLAFLVYGLVLFLLTLAVAIAFGLAAASFGAAIYGFNAATILILLLLLVVLGVPAMAVFLLSFYTGFRDIFPADR